MDSLGFHTHWVSQELYANGTKGITVCISAYTHATFSHWTLLTKYRFKVKIVKIFIMAPEKH